jgi:peptidylprolyl isomerase
MIRIFDFSLRSTLVIGLSFAFAGFAAKAALPTTNAAPAHPPVTNAAPAPATNAPAAAIAPGQEIDKETGKPVITTPSGLKYVDLVVGTGAEVKQGDHVAVKYVGKLQDGTVFDASEKHPEMGPTFNYEQGVTQLIAGWTEGVSTMKVGGKRKLIIPAALAYGNRSPGAGIPPNSDLVFEVELVKIK